MMLLNMVFITFPLSYSYHDFPPACPRRGKKDFSNGTATFEGICLVSWRCLYQIKGFKMLLQGGE
jgi:hypothetical protein